jgi:homoserine/homoserine lactone efflux protein
MPKHYLLFIIAALIASAVPGLAVVGAFTTSLKHGFKSSVIFSLGLVSATLIYFLLSGLGLLLLVQKYQFIFQMLKYIGVAYLFYIGVSCFFSNQMKIDIENEEIEKNEKTWGYFFAGLMVHLGNPKNILFFVAVLPQYIDPTIPIESQMGWLALGSEIPELVLLLMYGYFAIKVRPYLLKEGVAKIFNRVIGGMFMGLAIMLLWI